MIAALFPEEIERVLLYDLRGVDAEDIEISIRDRVTICDNWEEVYGQADIFMTCTVSKHRYIDRKPKDGALLLNVSLRDFTADIYEYTRQIAVDDWDEVCRENTDIEMLHKLKNLQKEGTFSIRDIVINGAFERLSTAEAVMFNPMGMAVFDIAVGSYFYRMASELGAGIELKE
ncbi:ornithine cyclodeaminase [compost metagenome]